MISRVALVITAVLLLASVVAAVAQQLPEGPPAGPPVGPPQGAPGGPEARIARPGFGAWGGGGVDQLMPPPQPQELDRLSAQLKLSDAQKAAIKGMAQQKQALIQPLMAQQPALTKQITDEMLKSAPDAAAAKRAISQLHTLRAQIAQHGVDFWVAVRAQLSPEQNSQLTEILQRRMIGPRNRFDAVPGDQPQGAPGRDRGNRQRDRVPGGPPPPDAPPPAPEPDPGY